MWTVSIMTLKLAYLREKGIRFYFSWVQHSDSFVQKLRLPIPCVGSGRSKDPLQ